MFKIDGISEIENSTAKDVTSVFLLVSVDKTAPMLTLSDPVFYDDMTTGAYQITGTADAGSKIIYGDDGASVNAGSDGTFTPKRAAAQRSRRIPYSMQIPSSTLTGRTPAAVEVPPPAAHLPMMGRVPLTTMPPSSNAPM